MTQNAINNETASLDVTTGSIDVQTAGEGIIFNNANAATLFHYESINTWTPVIEGSTVAGTATYAVQHGRYMRIGRMVWFTCNLEWTVHTGTGNMLVTGLPYIFAAASSFYPNPTIMEDIALPASTLWVSFDGINNTTTGELVASKTSAALALVQMSAAGTVHASGWYPTDNA